MTVSRIDIIGQNGNEGLHYMEGMRVIHKYEIMDNYNLALPFNSTILKVGMQEHDMYVWVEIPVEWKDEVIVKFKVYPTGIQFIPSGEHFDTVFDGQFVWHVYVEGVTREEVDFIPE